MTSITILITTYLIMGGIVAIQLMKDEDLLNDLAIAPLVIFLWPVALGTILKEAREKKAFQLRRKCERSALYLLKRR